VSREGGRLESPNPAVRITARLDMIGGYLAATEELLAWRRDLTAQLRATRWWHCLRRAELHVDIAVANRAWVLLLDTNEKLFAANEADRAAVREDEG
jgi:hypothetical protein